MAPGNTLPIQPAIGLVQEQTAELPYAHGHREQESPGWGGGRGQAQPKPSLLTRDTKSPEQLPQSQKGNNGPSPCPREPGILAPLHSQAH